MDIDNRVLEFERTVLVHTKCLLRFAVKLLRGATHAEDLVQETLLSAWRNFHQFERGTNCRAWLFKILLNRRNQEFTRLSGRVEFIDLDRAHLNLRTLGNVSDSYVIQAALNNLSKEHREVLLLCAVDGLSVKELSDLLQLPHGTVMSRLSRARAKLRTSLEPVMERS